jgi:hypothetical protein
VSVSWVTGAKRNVLFGVVLYDTFMGGIVMLLTNEDSTGGRASHILSNKLDILRLDLVVAVTTRLPLVRVILTATGMLTRMPSPSQDVLSLAAELAEFSCRMRPTAMELIACGEGKRVMSGHVCVGPVYNPPTAHTLVAMQDAGKITSGDDSHGPSIELSVVIAGDGELKPGLLGLGLVGLGLVGLGLVGLGLVGLGLGLRGLGLGLGPGMPQSEVV